jgi:hypothetical protein
MRNLASAMFGVVALTFSAPGMAVAVPLTSAMGVSASVAAVAKDELVTPVYYRRGGYRGVYRGGYRGYAGYGGYYRPYRSYAYSYPYYSGYGSYAGYYPYASYGYSYPYLSFGYGGFRRGYYR